MYLFTEIGQELGHSLNTVNKASRQTGLHIRSMGLTWEFHTDNALQRARLPKNRDLFLIGQNKPGYFRIRVNVEPLPKRA